MAPGTANEEYQRITPLKKLPVLILNDGDVILDSYVIVEYLNEIAGGSLIPDYGPTRWKVKTDHARAARHARRDAAVPLREDDAAAGRCSGRRGPTITGTGPGAAWRASRRATTC